MSTLTCKLEGCVPRGLAGSARLMLVCCNVANVLELGRMLLTDCNCAKDAALLHVNVVAMQLRGSMMQLDDRIALPQIR